MTRRGRREKHTRTRIGGQRFSRIVRRTCRKTQRHSVLSLLRTSSTKISVEEVAEVVVAAGEDEEEEVDKDSVVVNKTIAEVMMEMTSSIRRATEVAEEVVVMVNTTVVVAGENTPPTATGEVEEPKTQPPTPTQPGTRPLTT